MASPLPELAHFLRTRRARVAPQSVGLTPGGARRLPGLRRSEVAALAGISPEYYTRLEQGRQRHPSPEVLNALAAALRLNPDERRHLHRLASGPRRTAPPAPLAVPETALSLLRSVRTWPAYVVSPLRDVLAWNDAAVWLLTDFGGMAPHERNFAWFAFCDERARALFADWEAVARGNVYRLRDALAADPANPRGRRLVAELSGRDPRFTEFWEEHHVLGPNTGRKELRHPRAGRITLDYTGYVIPGPHALELVVMTAPEGSRAHRALSERDGA
ncbi:helix-turn-helix domain-containing protein [Actinomadura kijaniata]|uniref:MmyB family transcriptional regulator n=1 Tax=Actinomadura kijaniata TaxID=46161 RepID=UPI003F1C6696